jgi:long-chain fatty acid transport protein
MKRILVLFLMAALFMGPVIAGGIVTNTNHSAKYTRMQCRDATLGIDAVYYNPAGVAMLDKGFHFSINNQTIGQGRKVSSNYQFLNPHPKDYEASVSAPIFPGIYAAFVTGKFGVSLGFNPIGGGGGAKYDNGLPSLEYGVAELVPMLQAQKQPVTDYRMNAVFEGKSVFFGYQANLSYKINDMLSVGVGGRFVTAKETYTGHMKDIGIFVGGQWISAPDFFDGVASVYSDSSAYYAGLSTQFTAAATNLGMLVGTDPLTDPTSIFILNSLNLYSPSMTNNDAVIAFTGLATATATGAQLYAAGEAQAIMASEALADQEVDAQKTATGITPIVSVNFSPIKMLNIAVKYEFKTKLEFTNETVQGKAGLVGYDTETGAPIYLFPDGAKTHLDIPAMLSVGVTLNPFDPLMISTGMHYYFDKDANWDGREDLLDRGLIEFALGAEYGIGDHLAVSAGWLMTSTGVTEAYQTDQDYDLNTNTFGGGIGYKITDFLELNLAGSYTIYQEGSKSFQRDLGLVTETYNKDTWIVAVGVDISIAR